MAKQMYFVSGDQHRAMERRWADVLRRISGIGTTLNPQLVLDRLQEMIEMPAGASQPSNLPPMRMPQLVKGLFSPTWWKVQNVRRWNSVLEWGFTEEDFKSLSPPPPFPDLPFATVVLVPYLETPDKTYRELRKVIELEHWMSDLSGMGISPSWGEKLFMCGANHEPGLRWEVIDMAGQRFRDKCEFRTPSEKEAVPLFDLELLPVAERLPHAGVLVELAHSPYWARSLSSNGGAAPEIWIPGYMRIDTRLCMEMAKWKVGDGEHLSVHAYSNTDPYSAHRKGLHASVIKMGHRIGHVLATPVLL